MNIGKYIINSLLVFTFSFVFGIYINKFFEYLHDQYKTYDLYGYLDLLLAILQLIFVIIFTYILHEYKLFSLTFEYYNPHIIFSTFIFSLQTKMITTFKKYF